MDWACSSCEGVTAAHAAQADSAPVCIRLLSLGGAAASALDRRALQAELVPPARAGGPARTAAPLPGPLADLRLPGGHVDALRTLWVQVWRRRLHVASGVLRTLHGSMLCQSQVVLQVLQGTAAASQGN